MTPETSIARRVALAISRLGARAWRNNVGRVVRRDGKWLDFGLCRGSSDYIGFYPYVVQQRDVGRSLAVFMAIEVKAPAGRVTKHQRAFLDAVERAGGIAAVVRSPEDVEQTINGFVERR